MLYRPSQFIILLAASVLALAVPASARTRDDIVSSALRCSVIGESRQWLDCYYGAAQLMRAQLGMRSALPAQVKLVAAPPVGGQIQDQHTRDVILSNAIRCDDVVADREWLDCYYNAAKPMRAQLGLPGAASLEMPLQQAERNDGTTSAQFGMLPRLTTTGGKVGSRLTSYTFDRYGIFTVALSNGQVWRQISGDTKYAHWSGIAANYTAIITRGALGSFNLRVQKSPGLFKVVRIA